MSRWVVSVACGTWYWHQQLLCKKKIVYCPRFCTCTTCAMCATCAGHGTAVNSTNADGSLALDGLSTSAASAEVVRCGVMTHRNQSYVHVSTARGGLHTFDCLSDCKPFLMYIHLSNMVLSESLFVIVDEHRSVRRDTVRLTMTQRQQPSFSEERVCDSSLRAISVCQLGLSIPIAEKVVPSEGAWLQHMQMLDALLVLVLQSSCTSGASSDVLVANMGLPRDCTHGRTSR